MGLLVLVLMHETVEDLTTAELLTFGSVSDLKRFGPHLQSSPMRSLTRC